MLRGAGSSPKGDLPFFYQLLTLIQKKVKCSGVVKALITKVVSIVDFDKLKVITSRQSQAETPNYQLRDLVNNQSHYKFPRPATRCNQTQRWRRPCRPLPAKRI